MAAEIASCLPMQLCSLPSLLEFAAKADATSGLLTSSQGAIEPLKTTSYRDLLERARARAKTLEWHRDFVPTAPVLIYLDEHLETFTWFWAVLCANAVPVLIPPVSNVPEKRHKYLQELAQVLEDPMCITSKKLVTIFDGQEQLKVSTIESLTPTSQELPDTRQHGCSMKRGDDLAILMLTSGSTGTPKAVKLTHNQILSAVLGKVAQRARSDGSPFLNWVGLDHVACITEIHLTAMHQGVNQIHLYASDVVSDPEIFLLYLSQYRVARTFAPNFLLARLAQVLQSSPCGERTADLHFDSLVWLGSGGEANDMMTCTALSEFLKNHGAPANVLVPGFGMTETCAGIIYNFECPEYDQQCHNTFSSLGKCIPGVEARITSSASDGNVSLAAHGQVGDLEVRGKPVFEGYYNNDAASKEAFTRDGWFKTGDQGMIDLNGNLSLTGRLKDTMIINGVQHQPQEIESLLEQNLRSRVTRVICFPYRKPESRTEQVCIIYITKMDLSSPQELVETLAVINRLSVLHAAILPFVIGLNDESQLPKSTLGKISKTKLRTMFETGEFASQADIQHMMIREYNRNHLPQDCTDTEALVLEDLRIILGTDSATLDTDSSIFQLGITSVELIRLKRQIDMRLGISIPITTLILNPTARSLARAIKDIEAQNVKAYNPVVPLCQEGSQNPLWLVHPGVGEVLVFLGLSKLLVNRPIYALRARGFDGESFFSSIDEAVTTYCDAIKRIQPRGPYAIAGYSFGSMLSFEIAKRLERESYDEVRFLGTLNLPPHIKWRMRQLGWTECLLHLAYFLDLLSESRAEALIDELRPLEMTERDLLVSETLKYADQERLTELALDGPTLTNWADLAFSLQNMAVDYEPAGSVSTMDIFYAEPLRITAKSKQEWRQLHLERWQDFTRTEPVFHEVEGAHYTMLSPAYVHTFAETLQRALRDRGL